MDNKKQNTSNKPQSAHLGISCVSNSFLIAQFMGWTKAAELLYQIFKIIPALNPSKRANDYWLTVNKTILDFSNVLNELWKIEKMASIEAIMVAKNEGLKFLAAEREKIMRMTHDEALKELIKLSKIESKIKIIESIKDNGLFEIK